MTHYRSLCAVLLATLGAVTSANAQVLRCEDANGRVTYTDGSCPSSQRTTEVMPPQSAQDKALQEERYQQALERKNAELAQQAERDAAQRQAQAERAAAEAALRPPAPPPPSVVVVPAPEVAPPAYGPSYGYGPMYPPRPPHVRPPRPHPPKPKPNADGYNCNVFRCYDGKGNTWSRP